MKWIDSTDLKQWADKKDCQLNLGALLGRIITESIKKISRMRFSSGDATQYSGWDGILISEEQTEKIPLGVSVWEWGCEGTFKEKAKKEYKKRTANPLGHKLEESTFIFVTPRVWEDNKGKNNKVHWIEERKRDGWKDIRIYDAIDLENWIDKNPVAGLWLSQKIRKYPDSWVQSAEQFWKDWKIISEERRLTPSLVVAGRSEQIVKLREWLKSKPPSVFVLRAFTREEALVFLCAAIKTMEDEERAAYFSRTLIVTNIDAFSGVYRIHKDHILINYFDETDKAINAVAHGNHVFIPIGPDSTNIEQNAELQVLGKEELVAALKGTGFTEEEAWSLSKESGRSLSVLRRMLQDVKNQPAWAKGEKAKELTSALLLGRWDDTKTLDESKNEKSKFEDRKVVELLSKKSYDKYLSELIVYKNEQDPPLFQFSEKWRLVSPIDSWFALAPFITSEQLNEFGEIVEQVVGAEDPEFELDEDQRYRAEMLGAIPRYSDWLTQGVLQTLVLIALHGKKISVLGDDDKAQQWADKIVFELLNGADEKKWFSVSTVLPQLAEASPESFLSCVEESLSFDNPKIRVLFREGKDPMFSRCNHSGLLWALESLAWCPDYLTRVTLILGKLASMDPGGRWANRPIGSLRGIFLAWLPYTLANLEVRLNAIGELCKTDKAIGFKLLLDLLPRYHDIGEPTFKPRWRWFSELKERRVTWSEVYRAYSAFLDILLSLAGNDGQLIAKILPSYGDFRFNKQDMENIYQHIDSCLNDIKNGKKDIRDAMRKLISNHRTYSDAEWALPQQEVDRLQSLYEKIDIEDIDTEYKWLFDDYYPELFNANRRDHKEFERAVEEERLQAINSLFDSRGLKGIIELAQNVKFPFLLGESLARSGKANEENELRVIDLFGKGDQMFNFSKGFVYNNMRLVGESWVNRIVKYLRSKEFSKELIVNFLICLDHNKHTWKIVEEFGGEIKSMFWKKCNAMFGDEYSGEMKNYYYENMLVAKRFLTAMDSASMYPTNIKTEFIVEILEKAATSKADEPYKFSIDPFHCVQLFKIIDKRNDFEDYNRLYQLEWQYINLLCDNMWDRPPKMLHKDMSENPESFVQVLRFLYKPKDDEEMIKVETKGLSEAQIKTLAKKAYDLLHSFKTIPGCDENGKIDYDKLSKWGKAVIDLSKKAKREYQGYYYIGEIFAKGIEKDKIPPDEICLVIEEIKNKDLEQGFYIATLNRRGGFSKGLWEGGVQERGLAENYLNIAKELKGKKFRRTSLLYEKIAKSYEFDAHREDERAKEMESEY